MATITICDKCKKVIPEGEHYTVFVEKTMRALMESRRGYDYCEECAEQILPKDKED